VAERCFTPQSARQALEALRPAAETLRRLVGELERTRPERILPDQPVAPAYFARVARLHLALSEIRRRGGVRIQDLRQGVLGFPARRAGRRVLLCWRVGETGLAFWSEPGVAPAVHRPVDDDGPWEDG
jgi:hypothetical protein